MSHIELTDREREYLECEVPPVSTGSAFGRVITGLLASIFQAAFTPGSGKADQKLFRTIREINYTKYKIAVLHKQEGTLSRKDMKLLTKLNKKPFILESDTYDPDAYTQKIYEEYMRMHSDTDRQ